MSLTKIVATFAFVITLTVAFSSPNEVQGQSGSRSVGDAVSAVAGSSSRSVPSVVTDFGGSQSFGDQQTYNAPQFSGAPMDTQYSGAPMDTQYSSAPMDTQYSGAPMNTQYSGAPISSGYSPAVSSGCGCSAAPAPAPMASPCGCSSPAPQPVASPCGGGCGGGCGSACGGNRNFGTLRRAPATGISGGLFQRGRPCGCN